MNRNRYGNARILTAFLMVTIVLLFCIAAMLFQRRETANTAERTPAPDVVAVSTPPEEATGVFLAPPFVTAREGRQAESDSEPLSTNPTPSASERGDSAPTDPDNVLL